MKPRRPRPTLLAILLLAAFAVSAGPAGAEEPAFLRFTTGAGDTIEVLGDSLGLYGVSLSNLCGGKTPPSLDPGSPNPYRLALRYRVKSPRRIGVLVRPDTAGALANDRLAAAWWANLRRGSPWPGVVRELPSACVLPDDWFRAAMVEWPLDAREPCRVAWVSYEDAAEDRVRHPGRTFPAAPRRRKADPRPDSLAFFASARVMGEVRVDPATRALAAPISRAGRGKSGPPR